MNLLIPLFNHLIHSSMNQFKNFKKGFTLIELLVVISIIGLLSAVVLSSLSNARMKGRDARRISDIRQLRNALELYRSDNGRYPSSGGSPIEPYTLLNSALVPRYIASIPRDPKSGWGCRGPSGEYCYSYPVNGSAFHLGALLETSSAVIGNDVDFNSASAGYYYHFNGETEPGGSSGYIYDIRP